MKGRGRKWVVLVSLAAVALVVAVAAPGAWAGKPEMERVDIDETFFDEFLSEECGTDVWTTARRLIVFRSLDGPQLVELTTLNVALTATADGNNYRFRDVGADQVRITKDGAILSVIGQIPFDFIGVLKIDLDTDEVAHEPGHLIGDRLAEACAALTA